MIRCSRRGIWRRGRRIGGLGCWVGLVQRRLLLAVNGPSDRRLDLAVRCDTESVVQRTLRFRPAGQLARLAAAAGTGVALGTHFQLVAKPMGFGTAEAQPHIQPVGFGQQLQASINRTGGGEQHGGEGRGEHRGWPRSGSLLGNGGHVAGPRLRNHRVHEFGVLSDRGLVCHADLVDAGLVVAG